MLIPQPMVVSHPFSIITSIQYASPSRPSSIRLHTSCTSRKQTLIGFGGRTCRKEARRPRMNWRVRETSIASMDIRCREIFLLLLLLSASSFALEVDSLLLKVSLEFSSLLLKCSVSSLGLCGFSVSLENASCGERGTRSSLQHATRRNGCRHLVRDSRGMFFRRERVVTANSVSQLLYTESGSESGFGV